MPAPVSRTVSQSQAWIRIDTTVLTSASLFQLVSCVTVWTFLSWIACSTHRIQWPSDVCLPTSVCIVYQRSRNSIRTKAWMSHQVSSPSMPILVVYLVFSCFQSLLSVNASSSLSFFSSSQTSVTHVSPFKRREKRVSLSSFVSFLLLVLFWFPGFSPHSLSLFVGYSLFCRREPLSLPDPRLAGQSIDFVWTNFRPLLLILWSSLFSLYEHCLRNNGQQCESKISKWLTQSRRDEWGDEKSWLTQTHSKHTNNATGNGWLFTEFKRDSSE